MVVPRHEGKGWQIAETSGEGRALLVDASLAERWIKCGLVAVEQFAEVRFGERRLFCFASGPSQILCPVADGPAPEDKVEAIAFAQALRATRAIEADAPLQDAIYVERMTRLLPTYAITARVDDDVVLGYWLTGGAPVSVNSFRRLKQAMSWLGASHLKDVVEAGGFTVSELVMPAKPAPQKGDDAQQVEHHAEAGHAAVAGSEPLPQAEFSLPGRPALEAFFNEHVVDIVRNRDRYQALGIGFPAPVVLHGPPGCGKTFAVERLVDFLGWPSFQIDASSVASPYIHDTSKKVSEIFEKAIEASPSVLVIDEMEAFLADREMGSGHHRVEEVAEFLRRIPEASKNGVLIVAMTNRVEMIDPAILRRGRFDHIIGVGFASEVEILSLLESLVANIPRADDVDLAPLTKALAGRPLSDIAFVVREGSRLAARSGSDRLTQAFLLAALQSTPAREREGGNVPRRIGFV
jgi:cell division protease FtsH